MKSITRIRLVAIFLAVTALVMVLMVSQRAVKAAPPSGASVTGTIKLDGTAPHQKPIDMSKEPSCAAKIGYKKKMKNNNRTIGNLEEGKRRRKRRTKKENL